MMLSSAVYPALSRHGLKCHESEGEMLSAFSYHHDQQPRNVNTGMLPHHIVEEDDVDLPMLMEEHRSHSDVSDDEEEGDELLGCDEEIEDAFAAAEANGGLGHHHHLTYPCINNNNHSSSSSTNQTVPPSTSQTHDRPPSRLSNYPPPPSEAENYYPCPCVPQRSKSLPCRPFPNSPVYHHHHSHQQSAALSPTTFFPSPPRLLKRAQSFSSLSVPYRAEAGRFLSESLERVDESFDDVAEMVSNMHIQERDHYAPPPLYLHRLEHDPVLASWRHGSVRWFTKVVEHLQANREIISTSTNFLDRYVGAQLSSSSSSPPPPPLGSSSTSACSFFSFGPSSSFCSTPPSFSSSNTPLAMPKALSPLMDQISYENIVLCALVLAMKMHQGDSTSNVSQRLAPLTSNPLPPRALCEFEFRMIGALGRRLNPPTAGTLIHHLLHFLPEREDKGLVLMLDDHANELALMALETPELARFPVSVIAVAAILASFTHLRSSGAVLEASMESRWLTALESNNLDVEPEDVNACLESLSQASSSFTPSDSGCEGDNMWIPPSACPLTSMYLPHFLNPPESRPTPSTPEVGGGGNKSSSSPFRAMRSISPTGVGEIAMLEGGYNQQQHHQQQRFASHQAMTREGGFPFASQQQAAAVGGESNHQNMMLLDNPHHQYQQQQADVPCFFASASVSSSAVPTQQLRPASFSSAFKPVGGGQGGGGTMMQE